MPTVDFASFLSRSLQLLAAEASGAHQRLTIALAGRALRITVDAPPAVLRFGEQGFDWIDEHQPADMDLRVDRQTLLDLIDARIALVESILQDRFHLRGPVEAIEWFYDALLIYLDGAVRCPSFPGLLAEFRAKTAQSTLPFSREVT